MFLPWGCPQVGEPPPLVAVWGLSSCAEASCSSSDSEKFIFYIASLSTWFRVCVSKHNFTYGWHIQLYFLCLHRKMYCTLHSLRLFCTTATIDGVNAMPCRWSKLIGWEQNRSKATIRMLGKIPLVKGFHVIFTKFHECVAHEGPTVPTECPRTTTGMPVSPSVAVNVDFRGYLQFLCICHWKPFRRSFLFHCWKNKPTFCYR